MSESDRNRKRGFVVRWILLCGVGLGAGLSVGLGVSAPIEAVVGMMLVAPIVMVIAGSLLGAVQWLAVWRSPRAGALWVGASALGFGLGMTLGVVALELIGRAFTGEQLRLVTMDPVGRFFGLALAGTMAGLAVGAAQRVALRRVTAISGRWILMSAAGFGLGLPAGSLTADLLLGGLRSPGGFAAFLGVAGLVIGALTVKGAQGIAAGLPVRSAAP